MHTRPRSRALPNLAVILALLLALLAPWGAARGAAASPAPAAQYDCALASGIPETDCVALVALYESTGGPSWTHSEGWLTTSYPCFWYGVSCSSRTVFSINLRANNLVGEIPPQISLLQNTWVVNLGANHLSGAIPIELGQMFSLQTLDLSGNHLSGALPIALSAFGGLEILDLSGNQLSGDIPAQLTATMSTMRSLDLRYNMLTASDPKLRAVLSARQPGWDQTQTITVAGVSAQPASPTSVRLTWSPIAYTGDGGGYVVLAAKAPGAIFAPVGQTASKADGGITVTGLTPGATYAFSVRTSTPQHGAQPNDLLSFGSVPVSIALAQNRAPSPAGDAYAVGRGAQLVVGAAAGVLANDGDADGDPLSAAAGAGPSHGALLLAADGSFTYTPQPGYSGPDSFTYQASDGLASAEATVTLTVREAAQYRAGLPLVVR